MSEIYDNWERLVRATLRREDLKLSGQRTPSDLPLASSSSSFSYGFSSSSSLEVSSFNFAQLCFGGIEAATRNFDPVKKVKKVADGVELYPGGVYNIKTLKAATNKFNPDNKIGGVGSVYKGVLPDGFEIAVKRLLPMSKQRARDIINEIGTMYALRHPNLARPLGCYAEGNQILLVYKYTENISLQHALFDSEEVKSRLNWQTRVKICLGMAKGLAFLHEESKLDVVHGNIKPSNILLDKDFNVKISDLFCAQLHDTTWGDMPRAKPSVYMAPEYIQGLSLTPKVDVYSFGIVTLEIVSGQNIVTFRPEDQNIYLLNTAYQYHKQNKLISLVDPWLIGDFKPTEADRILNLAMDCVSPSFDLRPSMSHVVEVLEGN